MRVAAFCDGRLHANGKPVTFTRLEAKVRQIVAKEGAVMWYREDPAGNWHPNAEKAFQMICDIGPHLILAKNERCDQFLTDKDIHPDDRALVQE